jgi:putative ABC transport system permease protein
MSNMPEHKANLIAFDPASDFTVLPWVQSKLGRAAALGDVYIGSRRTESLGDEVEPCNTPAVVYGKLGRSGVGPLDESMFATYDTVAKWMESEGGQAEQSLHRDQISAALIKLNFGATPEQVRFAIAKFKGIKVISGAPIVTSTRQTTTALLGGMLVFVALMLLGSLILVSLLFTAIIEERSREIGLLSAIGTRRTSIVNMLVTEAAFATGFGGIGGILLGSGLLTAFQRSIVFYLETMHIDFVWPNIPEIITTGLVCASIAALLGLLGSFLPAWRAGGREAYQLIQGEMK